MSGTVRVRRVDGALRVGAPPTHPEWTALVEARGAVLTWDVTAEAPVPAAEIHDPAPAADWLWQVYGSAADAVLAVSDGEALAEVALPPDAGRSPVALALRRLALLGWQEAWWPASFVAGVPALPAALRLVEAAVVAADVEELLDDEDAVERLLLRATASGHPPAALAALFDHPELGDQAMELAQRLAEVAEAWGVPPTAPARAEPRPAAWALAAGGAVGDGLGGPRGGGPVDWTLVPAGLVDAGAELRWALVRRQDRSLLEVAVPRAPGAPVEAAAPLRARGDGVEFELGMSDDGREFVGAGAVEPTALLVPAARRRVVVWAPEFAPAGAEPAPAAELVERQSAVIAYARARLAAPDGSLAERAAALLGHDEG
ncbi:hypothetical protein [Streptomyces profundus]|uniref:hypothetical protein n=1 Tax=Streptomyces profundus TaxID=2867410 RepID=UPI001D1699A5|nr:hypothetical protein [Streptomyces sp. MA3_2.13]UED87348.1 hypothetical protein K4G22_26640 [Streptomyces sp. MA3_2.13]